MPKIEIQYNDMSGANDYQIYDRDKGKRLNKGGVFGRNFDESEIEQLLGEREYKKFENGKNTFTVTKKQIFLLTNDFAYYSPSFANDRDVLNRNY